GRAGMGRRRDGRHRGCRSGDLGSARQLASVGADLARRSRLASLIALAAMTIKARRSGAALWTSSRGAPAYRFALACAPPLVAGFVLTPVFAATDLMARLPGCWLLLYGTALAAGGAPSDRKSTRLNSSHRTIS